MSTPNALVLSGPGTNRDRDLVLAFELAGAIASVVLIDEVAEHPELLDDTHIIGVAGGFSYGDALGAGRMMALELMSKVSEHLRAFVDSGRPMIGICNGFQVLTRAGLLPGTLGPNAHGMFECRWVVLDPEPNNRCVWTRGIEAPVHCPIAHGEGRYVHPDPASLAEAGQVALRYRSTNPNGSVADIAGVCNAKGNVLGLMPHPENFIVPRQHPQHTNADYRSHLGLQIFNNGVAAASRM